MDFDPRRLRALRQHQPHLVLRLLTVAAVLVSLYIHCELVPEHMQEGVHKGMFFVLSALALAWLAWTTFRSPTQRSCRIGIALLGVLIVLYFIVRTWSLPGMGMKEEYDTLGRISKGAEAVAVLGLAQLLHYFYREAKPLPS